MSLTVHVWGRLQGLSSPVQSGDFDRLGDPGGDSGHTPPKHDYNSVVLSRVRPVSPSGSGVSPVPVLGGGTWHRSERLSGQPAQPRKT